MRYGVLIMNGAKNAAASIHLDSLKLLGGSYSYDTDFIQQIFEHRGNIAKVFDYQNNNSFWMANVEWQDEWTDPYWWEEEE